MQTICTVQRRSITFTSRVPTGTSWCPKKRQEKQTESDGAPQRIWGEHVVFQTHMLVHIWTLGRTAEVVNYERRSKIFLSTAPKQGCFPDCLPASVGMTQAPMWRRQAASLAVSHDGSESGPRHGRSVSSSSPLIGSLRCRPEVTCCAIGWDQSQWKI